MVAAVAQVAAVRRVVPPRFRPIAVRVRIGVWGVDVLEPARWAVQHHVDWRGRARLACLYPRTYHVILHTVIGAFAELVKDCER
jgi:hypothetical protein